MKPDYSTWTGPEVKSYAKHYGCAWMLFGIVVGAVLQRIRPLDNLNFGIVAFACTVLFAVLIGACAKETRKKQNEARIT